MTRKNSLPNLCQTILNKFISARNSWKSYIEGGFEATDLAQGVMKGYTTEELVEKIAEDGKIDLEYNTDREAKDKIRNKISQLNNFAKEHNWGFGIRSVPIQGIKKEKLKEKTEDNTNLKRAYHLIIWNQKLLDKVAKISHNGVKARMTRWGYYISEQDANNRRAYEEWERKFSNLRTGYVELMENKKEEIPSNN